VPQSREVFRFSSFLPVQPIGERNALTRLNVVAGYTMPYLRLYSRPLPIEQKRVIAEKLIEITLRSFRLGAAERYQTSIQFITLPHVRGVDGLQPSILRDADFILEVLAHGLTEDKKRAFAEEAPAMLTHLVPVKPWSRIARVFGIKWASPNRMLIQFHELSPAISDPFVVYSERLVA